MASIKKITGFLVLMLVLSFFQESFAQCAMCRATVENNVNEGASEEGKTIGAGLNSGILYLMCIPYILACVIAFMWYRESKKTKERRIKTLQILQNKLS
ncbi:MAG: hypothetical protein ACK4ND_00405 [Cytophagaceae bacterium]